MAVREDDVTLIADMCDQSRGLSYVTYSPDLLTDDTGINIIPGGGRFKVLYVVLM